MKKFDEFIKLDGMAAVNLDEPSEGDLKRLHDHYMQIRKELYYKNQLLEECKNVLKKLEHCSVGVEDIMHIDGIKVSTLKVDNNGNFLQEFPAKELLKKLNEN